MESPEAPRRPAKRKEPKTGVVPKIKTVGVSESAFGQVESCAKKLKMSKVKYASAAIAFFAESGLDPTAERPAGLADVNSKVSIETRAVRVQNADIGNRLIGIMRTWEKALYGFLQQQQAGTLNYLEQIENNIIRHQVAVETSFLSPLVELVIKGGQDSYIARMLTERVHIKMTGKEDSSSEASNKHYNAQRDANVATEVRTFLQANGVAAPGRAPKPVVPDTPKPVITTDSTAGKSSGVIPK
jgi:hypothetical protein